ncbi:MAG: hypothetical protein CMM52_06855 [Rhodospirillaceae bacterium]|nr:hypothetical protein [Rhodospirillaceae bacterium]|tara:strand:+ start:11478 stop:12428 length:951 start_codon:yes stop_codon:yes gene_type:complete
MNTELSDSWQIIFYIADKAHLSIFETALSPLVDGISMDQDASSKGRRIVGFCSVEPEFDEVDSRVRISAAAAGIDAPKVDIETVAATDWVSLYQQRTPPVTIGNFFIYPAHYKDPLPSDKIAITLEAGLAFGTGEHQTTEGCLRNLESLAASGYVVRKAIDVGCGSAILAIGLSRLWPDASVFACDIDSTAIETASENISINGCEKVVAVIQSDFYEAPRILDAAPFDLIVANILAGPLISSAAETAKQLSNNGRLILSGILKDQTTEVIDAYERAGLIVIEQDFVDEWATISFTKKSCPVIRQGKAGFSRKFLNT